MHKRFPDLHEGLQKGSEKASPMGFPFALIQVRLLLLALRGVLFVGVGGGFFFAVTANF